MKKIFPSIILLFFFGNTNAQLIVYSEKFDELFSYSLSGWHSSFTGMVPWQAGLPGLVGGCLIPVGGPMSYTLGTNKVAAIVDCGASFDYNNLDVFSYTPPISLTGISGAWLRYDSYFNSVNNGVDTEKATVEISTDSGATWTVLQQVPASVPAGNFTTYNIDLSAYSLASDIRIGFRYSDGGGWLQGWAIDNVKVLVPAHKDLALLSATPIDPLQSYIPVGTGFSHHATVYNAGLDTIHSFVLNYKQGTGAIKRDTISGVALPPFSTNEFLHAIPDSIPALGNFPVMMWVTLDSDQYHYNDTAITIIRGSNFTPTKRLVLESGEATWYDWTPRNITYLASVPSLDIDACLVSVHDNDPMMDTTYRDFIFNLGWNYVPYILFDRRVSVPLDSFYQYLNAQKNYFGFADIDLDGTLDGSTLTVNATVRPAVDLIGDYRLALVVTEDTVRGTGSNYDQVNGYAGGGHGVMGGFEGLPDPVPAAQMAYNHVARQICPGPEGQYGCLPTALLVNGSYECSFTTPLDPAWKTNHLHAMVFLIRHDDSTILNGNKIPFALKTSDPAISFAASGVYPNPADQSVTAFFKLDHTEEVYVSISDLSGRTLYQYPMTNLHAGKNEITLPLQHLTNGLYLVNFYSAESHTTQKLEVLHR